MDITHCLPAKVYFILPLIYITTVAITTINADTTALDTNIDPGDHNGDHVVTTAEDINDNLITTQQHHPHRSLLQTGSLTVTNFGNLNGGWQRYVIGNIPEMETIAAVFISDNNFTSQTEGSQLGWDPMPWKFTPSPQLSLPISIKFMNPYGVEVVGYEVITSFVDGDTFVVGDNFGDTPAPTFRPTDIPTQMPSDPTAVPTDIPTVPTMVPTTGIPAISSISPTLIPTYTPVPASFPPIRINCGTNITEPTFTDDEGNVWTSDEPYQNGGNTYSVTNPINGTVNDELYQSERWMHEDVATDLVYTFPSMLVGSYTVALYFAEIWTDTAGVRVFDVEIQGTQVLNNIDLAGAYGKYVAHVHIENEVQVTDGTLEIKIVRQTQNPKISAIEIVFVGQDTLSPSMLPTEIPTATPTSPSLLPSNFPTVKPTAIPTTVPTGIPTASPTGAPTVGPTGDPTLRPTSIPTVAPTAPSLIPTIIPTAQPHAVPAPTNIPTDITNEPTMIPTLIPTGIPTVAPTGAPTLAPTDPSLMPTGIPTVVPIAPTLIPTPVPIIPTPQPTTFPPIRINCGISDTTATFTDDEGNVWTSDEPYQNGGGTYSITNDIAGTVNDELYQSERWMHEDDATNLVYTFPSMPNDIVYTVTLHFAEIYFDTAGARVFDIAIQGTQVVNDLDIYGSVGGNAAYSYVKTGVEVTDGTLEIKLVRETQNPKISAIEIIQDTTAEVFASIYINSGGYTPDVIDNSNNLWIQDTYFVATDTTTISTIDTITGTATDGTEIMYQNARVGTVPGGSITYNIPLTGVFDITLSFAEIENTTTTVGARVMTIEVEGNVEHSGFDIIASAPGDDTAITLECQDVAVQDGSVDIVITATVGTPLISGICLRQTSTHFAHSVIELDDKDNNYISFEDLDDDGSVLAELDGSGSHTHYPGGNLVTYVWSWVPIAGSTGTSGSISDTLTPTVTIDVGTYDLTLDVTDDFANTDSFTVTLDIKAGSGYDGCLAYYYDYSSEADLTSIPDFLTKEPDVITTETNIDFNLQTAANAFGNSGLAFNFAAQFICYIDVTTGNDGLYGFTLESNDGSALYIGDSSAPLISLSGVGTDNTLGTVSDSILLSEGRNTIRVEYFDGGITSSLDHGLKLYYQPPGTGSDVIIPSGVLQYGLFQQLSIISSIFPTSGTSNGGTQVTITGEEFLWEPADSGDDGLIVIIVDEFGEMMTVPTSDITWSSQSSTTLTIIMPENSNTLIDVKATIYLLTPAGYSNGAEFTYLADAFDAPAFGSVQTLKSGQGLWTVVALGPDEKIYAATYTGVLWRFELSYNTATKTYNVISEDSSNVVKDHVNNEYNPAILGISFDPNDDPSGLDGNGPRIYIAYSELFHGEALDDKRGNIAIVSGADMENIQDIVTGLPVSDHDHGINGMTWLPDGTLVVLVGGNTNAGIPGALSSSGEQDEGYFSAAAVGVNIHDSNFNGVLNYDTEGFPTNFNNGVYLYATGLRNAYDLAYHPKYDTIYATDNGPNGNFGFESTSCTTNSSAHPQSEDELNRITFGGYYGHPNRLRGSIPGFEHECTYYGPSAASTGGYTAPLGEFLSSTNGVSVYYTNNFGGQWKDSLILGRYIGIFWRAVLNEDGTSLEAQENFPTGTSGLDNTVDPRGTVFWTKRFPDSLQYMVPDDDPTQYTSLFVISVWPNMGPLTGGRTIKIRGYNFGTLVDTTVRFGDDTTGPECVVTSVGTADEFDVIVCDTPDFTSFGTHGVTDVYVNTDGNAAVIHDSYTFVTTMSTSPLGSGNWFTRASFPFNLGEISAIAVDDLGYYVFGGELQSNGNFQNMYYYSVETDGWTQLSDPPSFALGDHQTQQVYNGKIYTFGGDVASTAPFMRVYDPSTDSWTQLAALEYDGGNYALLSPSSGIIDDVIYVAGGIDTTDSTVDTAFAYNITEDAWSTIASMPDGGRNHAAGIAYDGLFYIFGGRQGGNTAQDGFSQGFVYNPVTNIWSQTANLLEGAGGNGQAVEVNGKLIIIGGENSNNVVGTVQRYDPLTDSWEQLTDMPTARHGTAPVAIGNVIYVACGGIVQGYSQSGEHEAMSFL